MGRLALGVTVGGFALCLALIGLMVAANEASKEGHNKRGVSVDLDGNAVQSAALKSFGSVMDFPKLTNNQLDEIDYLTFAATSTSLKPYDMRYRISGWMRDTITKRTTLYTQDGSTITIEGDGSAAEVKNPLTGDFAIKTSSSGRRLLGRNAEHCRGRTFSTIAELQGCMYGGDGKRRLDDHDPGIGGGAIAINLLPGAILNDEFPDEVCNTCKALFEPYPSWYVSKDYPDSGDAHGPESKWITEYTHDSAPAGSNPTGGACVIPCLSSCDTHYVAAGFGAAYATYVCEHKCDEACAANDNSGFNATAIASAGSIGSSVAEAIGTIADGILHAADGTNSMEVSFYREESLNGPLCKNCDGECA
jgi:hypothetical protein